MILIIYTVEMTRIAKETVQPKANKLGQEIIRVNTVELLRVSNP